MTKLEKRLRINDAKFSILCIILYLLLIISVIRIFINSYNQFSILIFLPTIICLLLLFLTYKRWFRKEEIILYRYYKNLKKMGVNPDEYDIYNNEEIS